MQLHQPQTADAAISVSTKLTHSVPEKEHVVIMGMLRTISSLSQIFVGSGTSY